FVVYHIATKPTKQGLTEPRPKELQNDHVYSTHLITLAYDEIYVLALEIIVYQCPSVTTIFVAKADSTGFGPDNSARLNLAHVTSAILSAFLESTVKENIPSRICLFARSQPQYIFPESSKNIRKHVLSDRGLVKWWIRVLSPVLTSTFTDQILARIRIPGAESGDIKSIIQAASQTNLWKEGDIFNSNSDRLTDKAVLHIPNFPDDPKSRFLDFIIAEGRADCTSTEQFFIELETRQEFLLGAVVSLIGVQGSLKPTNGRYSSSPVSEFPCAVVDQKTYIKLHDSIVTSTFENEESARNATKSCTALLPETARSIVSGSAKSFKKTNLASSTIAKPVTVINSGLIRKRVKPPRTAPT
ncbi:histone H3-K56 acetyltransferase, partial [Lipomyces oligophaga]|uniref:histone H3-K56 acetyltransferase n=1 Tax=Lipomyces oligophaga TaxID=45792 RepID=UPI0034CD8A06